MNHCFKIYKCNFYVKYVLNTMNAKYLLLLEWYKDWEYIDRCIWVSYKKKSKSTDTVHTNEVEKSFISLDYCCNYLFLEYVRFNFDDNNLTKGFKMADKKYMDTLEISSKLIII